jgi:hypothetical protein
MTRTAYNLNPPPFPFSPRFPMLLSGLLAATLAASPRLHAAEAGSSAARRSLTFDCDQRYVSQRLAGWLLGTDNFSQTHDRRPALYAEVARACATGAAMVRIEGVREGVRGTFLSQHREAAIASAGQSPEA